MDFTVLFYTGLMIAMGLLLGKVTKFIKLPNVTGYLLAGILVGPSILGLVNQTTVSGFQIIEEVALGFIAFSIGSELKISYFKRVGAKPIIIAFFEASFAVLLIFGLMLGYFALTHNLTNLNLRFSLILAAIAAATAPAATLMVIRQYKAKGKVTETLMSVVAIDDSVAVLLFGICVAIANAIDPTAEHGSVFMQVLEPIKEIVLSLGIGAAIGFILVLGTKWFTGRANRVSLTVGAVFLTMYISTLPQIAGSYILASMGMGFVFGNFSKKSEEVNSLIYLFTPPIFVLFFVLSGASLQISTIASVGGMGLIYLLGRIVGKFIGAYTGAKVTKSGDNVAKHLGFCLVPQAGVAIGLTIIASHTLTPELGNRIVTIILSSTVIYALTGAVITKFALKAAGEITIKA